MGAAQALADDLTAPAPPGPLPRGAARLAGWALAAAAAVLAGAHGGGARADGDGERAAAWASAAYFEAGGVPTLTLEVAPEDVARLRVEPRTYVPATLVEDLPGAAAGRRYPGVGVKLKGGAGSFRGVDDRPALTVDLDRFLPGQRFHGLARVHLNNSVQDETWVHEALCADLFTAAGVPTPRVGHARVRWNARALGLYVLKEGVDAPFVARRFPSAGGNLYDGGFCQDVDAELEKDGGHGPDDRRDLAALVAACREPDLALKAERLAAALDVDAFLTFTALERMTCHWDGYSTNRNNYRLYVRPTDGRVVFLPHGMDQTFGDPGASVLDPPSALVAEAVLSVPDFRTRYRARLVSLLPLFDADASLLPRERRIAARLLPVVEASGPAAARAWNERRRDLEERLRARDADLRRQVLLPDPPAVAFDARGEASVSGWEPRPDAGEPRLEQEEHAGRRALAIAATHQPVAASWRRRLVLPRGRYTLRADVAVKGVAARRDPQGSGAGLRISGAVRGEGLSGTAGWKSVGYDFEVEEGLRQVELVAELRADRGHAWFDVASLRLVRHAP